MSHAGEEKEPLLEAYSDEVNSNKGSTLEAGPMADELRVAAADLARRRCRRRRFLFNFITFVILTIVFTFGHRFKLKRQANSINILKDFPEHEPHQLPVVPEVILEYCADWKGDADDELGAPVYKDADGYHIPPRPKRLAPVRQSPTPGSHSISSSAEFKLKGGKPLYFLSRGSFSVGSLKVVQSQDESQDIKTTVKVITKGDHDESGNWHEHFLDVIRVCKITKEGQPEATGVGIFTPMFHKHHGCRGHHHDSPKFEVTVELPKSDDAMTISSLETDMPVFSQSLETEKGAVSYRTLHLLTAMAPVNAVDATAEDITVFNANAPITGNFKTSKSVVLATANAPIHVSLELENANSTNKTSAMLVTKNGPIIARNTLTATNWSESNTGNFSLVANTAHSNIGMTFPSAPVNSTLALRALNKLGSIDVALHPTYEGYFSLGTKLAKAEVIASEEEADPERKGRKRYLLTSKMRSNVFGETWWGKYVDRPTHWGNVVLQSALGSVVLRFNGTDV